MNVLLRKSSPIFLIIIVLASVYIGSEWSDWNTSPEATISYSDTAIENDQVYLVVKGNNTNLYYGYMNLTTYSFSGWIKISGDTSYDPSLVSNSSSLFLVVKDANNKTYLKSLHADTVSETSKFLTYDYTVFNIEDQYYAVDQTGNVDFSGENAYFVIQSAINATFQRYLGSRGTILLGKGYYNFGGQSLLLPNHFHLDGVGAQRVTLSADSVPIIRPMWGNYTFDVWISNLYLDGENSATYGLYWDIYNATNPDDEIYHYMLKVSDVMIRNADVKPVFLRTTYGENTICFFDNVRSLGKWYIERIFDSMFINIYCSGADFDSIVTNHFENWYLGGAYSPQLRIYGDSAAWPNSGNIFLNIRIDNPFGTGLSVEGYTCYNQFVSSHFANLNQKVPDNTYSLIVFANQTHHNLISGSILGNYRNNSPTFKHLIEEASNVHDNSYIGNIYQLESIGTSLLKTSHPSKTNFENSKQEFLATATSALSSSAIRYCSPIGLHSPSSIEQNRTIFWQTPGTITNFRFKSTVAPGEGSSITAYIRIDESTDYLPVAISDSTFQGNNNETVHISTGQTISVKCVPSNSPDTGIVWFAFDFYPDPETVVSR